MACTTILVGKKASYDGSTLIARNDDSGSGKFTAKKWVSVSPKEQGSTYKSVIAHLSIPLPSEALQYTAMPNAIKGEGIWAAAGVNALNVGMTATETITTNSRVLGADPLTYGEKNGKREPQGIGEEDLVVLVLPYIHSAREGALRLGSLIEKYGTYESNGIAFSDVNEIWWLESIGGHHWIAKKVADDKVVIMPNQFGLDEFDLEDALGAGKANLCSKDLKEFIADNHLDLSLDGKFNPRECFGSHDDIDHAYNTPRAYALLAYFDPKHYSWDKVGKEGPERDDLPWSIVPARKVTIEDMKYALGYHFQGTPYDPYLSHGEMANRNKYRSIGISRTSFLGLIQIRPYVPKEVAAIEWIAMGSVPFTSIIPFYSNIKKTPRYLNNTTAKVSTDNLYWNSRLIAALADSQFARCSFPIAAYEEKVVSQANLIIKEYDKKPEALEEANDKIAAMVEKETSKLLDQVLYITSCFMKNSYSMSDK